MASSRWWPSDQSSTSWTRSVSTNGFREHKVHQVYVAAAKVGGIFANDTYPAEFIHDNLAIQTNLIHSAWQYGAEKLLFLGSSCIYPKHSPQPMAEDSLLTGPLEPTNEWYAILPR
jgi:GDP-L-fucose synthase